MSALQQQRAVKLPKSQTLAIGVQMIEAASWPRISVQVLSLAAAGSVIVLGGGLSCAFFSPGANVATNDQLHLLAPGVQHLTSFSMYLWSVFKLAVLATAAVAT